MCTFVLLGSIVESLSYLCILLLPFIGSFYGTETLLQLSLIACVQCILVELLSRIWGSFSFVFQIIMFVALMLIPASWAPWYFVSLFKYTLLVTEPLLVVMDAVQAVIMWTMVTRVIGLAMDSSDEAGAWKWKFLTAIFLFSYFICYYFLLLLSLGDDVILNWISRATLAVLMIIHFCMFHSKKGSLYDITVVSLFCLMMLYMVKVDQPITHQTASSPDEDAKTPYIFFSSLFSQHLASFYAGATFLKHLLSPSVIFMCMIRMRSLHVISIILDYLISQDDWDGLMDYDDDLHQGVMSFKLDLRSKLAMIAVVTQVMIQYFTEPLFYSWPTLIIPNTISVARCMQLITSLGYYIYCLYTSHVENIHWLG